MLARAFRVFREFPSVPLVLFVDSIIVPFSRGMVVVSDMLVVGGVVVVELVTTGLLVVGPVPAGLLVVGLVTTGLLVVGLFLLAKLSFENQH